MPDFRIEMHEQTYVPPPTFSTMFPDEPETLLCDLDGTSISWMERLITTAQLQRYMVDGKVDYSIENW